MASFKVGQRVRIIGAKWAKHLIGKEATVIGYDRHARNHERNEVWPGYDLDVDGVGHWDAEMNAYVCMDAKFLAPLLNPGTERDAAAERFLNNLRKLGREPVTLTEKQLSSVSGGQPSGCAPIVGRGGK